MKHKSKIIYVSIIVCLLLITIIITLLLNKKYINNNQTTILLGNDSNEIVNVDNTFTSSFMDSEYLLSLVENDASKVIEEKVIKLSNLIDKADFVIINIGSIDIKNNISYFDDTFNYDLEILKRKEEILINNVKQTINHLLNKNKDLSIKIMKLSEKEYKEDTNLVNLIKSINNKYDALNKLYN